MPLVCINTSEAINTVFNKAAQEGCLWVQVIDTVFLFHFKRQRKLSLRFLASYVLQEDIQQNTHDSIEDARTAVKLYQVNTLQTLVSSFNKVRSGEDQAQVSFKRSILIGSMATCTNEACTLQSMIMYCKQQDLGIDASYVVGARPYEPQISHMLIAAAISMHHAHTLHHALYFFATPSVTIAMLLCRSISS